MNTGGVIYISLLHGRYNRRIYNKEGIGIRTFYFYTPKIIEKLSPENISVIYKKVYLVRVKKWFSVILQKN